MYNINKIKRSVFHLIHFFSYKRNKCPCKNLDSFVSSRFTKSRTKFCLHKDIIYSVWKSITPSVDESVVFEYGFNHDIISDSILDNAKR